MQNCKWKTKWVTFGLAVIVLAGSLAPSKAQAQENFAWVTYTNGVTSKKEISDTGMLKWPTHVNYRWNGSSSEADPNPELPKIAEIVVPEHAKINYIWVLGCVNLTNIVLQPAKALEFDVRNDYPLLYINAHGSGLRYITRRETMDVRVSSLGRYRHHGSWLPIRRTIQWTVLEKLPKMEIRTHSTDNGPEVEIVWRDGNLQIADAVNGEWRDHFGSSPLRIPLAVNSKAQQFYRIRKGDD